MAASRRSSATSPGAPSAPRPRAVHRSRSRVECVHRGSVCRPPRSGCPESRYERVSVLVVGETGPSVRDAAVARVGLCRAGRDGPKALTASREARAAATPSDINGTAAIPATRSRATPRGGDPVTNHGTQEPCTDSSATRIASTPASRDVSHKDHVTRPARMWGASPRSHSIATTAARSSVRCAALMEVRPPSGTGSVQRGAARPDAA